MTTPLYSATVAHSAISTILTGLTDSSTIGFVASALVLAAFGMKDMVNLRIVAICSNIAFITYALVLNLLPILILHTILLPLNGWRLMGALQQRRSAMGVGQSYVTVKLPRLVRDDSPGLTSITTVTLGAAQPETAKLFSNYRCL
jgi:hypothetical protein